MQPKKAEQLLYYNNSVGIFFNIPAVSGGKSWQNQWQA